MKTLITTLAIVSLTSCTSLDVMVDKSQLKAETDTHAFYPSTAITPVVNADALNTIINDNLVKANESLATATK
jgi:hypothetical protein